MGAVALVLVAAVTLVVTLGRMREPTSTTAATATGAKEPTANDAAPSFVANAPSSTASQLASASAVASPSPSPSGSAKPARPAFGARCVPPYYYEKGIKRFKPECL